MPQQGRGFLQRWPRTFSLALMVGFALILAGLSLTFGSRAAALAGDRAPARRGMDVTTPRDLADLRAVERRVQQVVKAVTPATVALQIGTSQGTGVIVSPRGYILTAAHVSGQPGRPATIVLADGTTVTGVTLGANLSLDAGLVRITTPQRDDWPVASLGDSSKLPVGTWCVALGHPGGYQPGRGLVVRVGRLGSVSDKVLWTDCTLVGGDSGGPLLDLQGRVIGIHSRIAQGAASNYHVPTTAFTHDWDALVSSQVIGTRPGHRPYLGIRGRDAGPGVQLTGVGPGSPAERGGLQADDVILSLDEEDIADFDALLDWVGQADAGRRVAVRIVREGRERTLMVALAGTPSVAGVPE